MHFHDSAWCSGSKVRWYGAADANLLSGEEEGFLIHHSEYEGEQDIDASEEGFDLLW